MDAGISTISCVSIQTSDVNNCGDLARRVIEANQCLESEGSQFPMIRKLKSGKYRLYSRKVDAKTGKRKNLGTFDTREAAAKHERAVQYFKRKG